MDDLFEAGELITAEFSPCRAYRYILRRRWDSRPPVGFILLNPSTADERADDPTIRRCIGYAKGWGYGGIVLGNLFALRSTDPRGLRSCADPIGPSNNKALFAIAKEIGRGTIICGWGSHGSYMNRGAEIRRLMRDEWRARPQALALTKAGEPGHPLYLRADLTPFEIFAASPAISGAAPPPQKGQSDD